MFSTAPRENLIEDDDAERTANWLLLLAGGLAGRFGEDWATQLGLMAPPEGSR